MLVGWFLVPVGMIGYPRCVCDRAKSEFRPKSRPSYGIPAYTFCSVCACRSRTDDVAAQTEVAAGTIESQTLVAGRAWQDCEAACVPHTVLRIRRSEVFLLRQSTGKDCHPPPRRIHEALGPFIIIGFRKRPSLPQRSNKRFPTCNSPQPIECPSNLVTSCDSTSTLPCSSNHPRG
jgi:hypothetical protein